MAKRSPAVRIAYLPSTRRHGILVSVRYIGIECCTEAARRQVERALAGNGWPTDSDQWSWCEFASREQLLAWARHPPDG